MTAGEGVRRESDYAHVQRAPTRTYARTRTRAHRLVRVRGGAGRVRGRDRSSRLSPGESDFMNLKDDRN